jgi:hypothetical protein
MLHIKPIGPKNQGYEFKVTNLSKKNITLKIFTENAKINNIIVLDN